MQVNFDLSKLKDCTNKAFYSLYACKERYLVLYGGAGSGKSIYSAQKTIVRCILSIKREYREKFVVLRKTQPAARRSVFALLRSQIEEWGIGKIVKINKTDMTMEFINGTQILCMGLDDPEKIKSTPDITSYWIEEPTEITMNDFIQLDLRLRGKTPSYKQFILSFNPITRHNWLYGYFFKNPLKNAKIVKTTFRDNRFIDEEYKQLLEDLINKDKVYYTIYNKGEWGYTTNLVFNNWEIKNIPTEYKYYEKVLNGLDFGFTHHAALVKIGILKDDLYIFDEIYEKGKTKPQLIELIKKKVKPDELITADSAEPSSILELKHNKIKIKGAVKAKDSVKIGISWIRRRKLYIHPQCIGTIKEIESYKYKTIMNIDGEEEATENPVEYNDDAMAALRYGVEAYAKLSGKRFGIFGKRKSKFY